MKELITPLACSLLLFGCGKPEPQAHASAVGFKAGATRDAIVEQLKQIHAQILKDDPELLQAEYTSPELRRPMQVQLGFADGKLSSVSYIPQ